MIIFKNIGMIMLTRQSAQKIELDENHSKDKIRKSQNNSSKCRNLITFENAQHFQGFIFL